LTKLLAGLGGLELAAILGGLALSIPGAGWIGSDTRMGWFVVIACAGGAAYAAAVWLILKTPLSTSMVCAIILWAVLLRLVVLFHPPFLSTDLFRYVWDGRVQVHGINPYRYVPADPALAALRDSAIFPHINRADYARTIYPPVAQMLYAAIAAIDQSTFAVKATMTGLDLITIGILLRLLSLAGLPLQRVLIYAWHPLPIWEFAGSGHVDAAAIALIAFSLLMFHRRLQVLTSIGLAGAVLIKFLPAVLVPALWRRGNRHFLAAFGMTIVAAYLVYCSVGMHVFGFLFNYTSEEGLSTGSGLFPVYLLERAVELPAYAGGLYLLLVAASLGVIALRTLRPGQPDDLVNTAGQVLVLATVLTAALTPHYPWYFAWLLLPSCLFCRSSVIYLSVAVFLLYLDQAENKLLWQSIVYVPFAVLVLFDIWRGRERLAETLPLVRRMS
jgi:hypothetical protein